MRISYYLNDRNYQIHPCPKCGSADLAFDAAMLAGVILCRKCKHRVIRDTIFDAMRKWGCDNVPLTLAYKHKLVVEELRVARKENQTLRDALSVIGNGHYSGASYIALCALQELNIYSPLSHTGAKE